MYNYTARRCTTLPAFDYTARQEPRVFVPKGDDDLYPGRRWMPGAVHTMHRGGPWTHICRRATTAGVWPAKRVFRVRREQA